MARWRRLVERHFPQAAAQPSNRDSQQQAGSSSSNHSRGRGGGNSGFRGARGSGRPSYGTSGGFRGNGSRVNPRPPAAGPPAKVLRRKIKYTDV
jgi:hypothetical protein